VFPQVAAGKWPKRGRAGRVQTRRSFTIARDVWSQRGPQSDSLCISVRIPNSACVEHARYAYSMSTMVQIRNVPDELLHELKARAAAQRMSLSDFLLARLGEIAEEPVLDDVLDRLAALPRRDLGASGAELVGEARSE